MSFQPFLEGRKRNWAIKREIEQRCNATTCKRVASNADTNDMNNDVTIW